MQSLLDGFNELPGGGEWRIGAGRGVGTDSESNGFNELPGSGKERGGGE